MRRASPLLLVLVVLSLLPAGAAGAVRSAVMDDPLDLATSIDGTPQDADLEQVRVYYDDQQGAVVATARLYRPLSGYGAYQLSLTLGTKSELGYCSSTPAGAFVTAPLRLQPGSGTMLVSGYTDGPPVSAITSADGREITVWAAHPVIAGRNWDCADASTYISVPGGYYSSVCGCIRYSATRDDIAEATMSLSGPGPLALPSLPVPPPAPAVIPSPFGPPVTPTSSRARRCDRLPALIRSASRRVVREQKAVRASRTRPGRLRAAKRLREARRVRATLRRERAVKC